MKHKLLVSDVDGTLMHNPKTGMFFWKELYQRAGVLEENKVLYSDYLQGTVTYQDVCDWTVEKIKLVGMTKNDILAIAAEHAPIEKAREVLKRIDIPVAVLSETIEDVLRAVFPDTEFSDIYTNRFRYDADGAIINMIVTPYYTEKKVQGLERIAEKHGLPYHRIAYVGDGQNDIPILTRLKNAGGLAIAFRPETQAVAEAANEVAKDWNDVHAYLHQF